MAGGDYVATEAQIRAAVKHNRTKDCIMIRPTKVDGGIVRAAAADAGQSLHDYILQACQERMQRDGFTPPAAPDAGDDPTP